MRHFLSSVFVFFFLAAFSGYAQGMDIGIELGSYSNISEDRTIVIEGQRSLKAAYSGVEEWTSILNTDPSVIRLTRGKTYIASFQYTILETPDRGFQALFWSTAAARVNSWLPGIIFTGEAGDKGEINFRSELGPYDDYRFQINFIGKGAIIIDSLMLKEELEPATIVAQNFEEPSLLQGQFHFDFDTPPISLSFGSEGCFSILRATNARDLDDDGRLEVVCTIVTFQPSGTMQVAEPIIILGNKNEASVLTEQFFPNGAPGVKNSPYIYFPDLNRDGKEDLVFAEGGLENPPYTGGRIVAALKTANGCFLDVSDLIPPELWATNSYALGIGDLDRNGTPEIVLHAHVGDDRPPSILTWTNNGFTERHNWISQELWYWPIKLASSGAMAIEDMDGDGFADIVCGGNWERPNTRIAFGSPGGFKEKNIMILPDGGFGHTTWEEWEQSQTAQGADCIGALVLDLNNDGKKDLFLMQQQILGFKKGFTTGNQSTEFESTKQNGGTTGAECAIQVFINKGSRKFQDIEPLPPGRYLGWKYYESIIPIDLNGDGFVDVVGGYWTAGTPTQEQGLFGTTFFLNDGTGCFTAVEGPEILPVFGSAADKIQGQLGMFIPTFLSEDGIEGLFLASRGDYHSGSLTVKRGTTKSTFGTGPYFQNAASLGFPGFNEAYYLRAYPDAYSAVKSGQFYNGLEHYRTVGIKRGYQAFAANATVKGSSGNDTLNLGIRVGQAKLSKLDEGWQLEDKSGRYGILKLINIETIVFLDGTRDLQL